MIVIYAYERNDTMSTRKSGKRRVRRDRLVFAAALLTFIILIIYILSHNISKDENKNEITEVPDSSDSAIVLSSNLEYEKKFCKYDDIHYGSLILVNDTHMYSVPAEQESMTSIDELKNDYYSIRNIGMLMDTLALKNFNSMMSGFYNQHSDKGIMITEALVTKERQDMMHNQALDNSLTVCKGGYSEHQTGLAADLSIYPESGTSYPYTVNGIYSWIKENCMKYGFIIRYPDSKSDKTGISGHENHFRYVVIPHAYYMTENNLSLEEYLQEIKQYSYGSKTLNISCFSKEYEVYYIRAKYDMTDNVDIYVPVNNTYTISGNNIDGFIVTVEK